MEKIYTGSTSKLRGEGSLDFALLIDEAGVLFIQILKNELPDAKKPGTHTKLILRVSDYINERFIEGGYASIKGINPEKNQYQEEADNNNSGFIKAILQHLFP